MSEELKFEKALERLEKIVEELEAGNIPLEDALKKYEEGVRLSRACNEKLTQAEKKIQILTKSLDGTAKRENFEFEAGEKD
jgi:exodeoxyribonuclease VII small subunit